MKILYHFLRLMEFGMQITKSYLNINQIFIIELNQNRVQLFQNIIYQMMTIYMQLKM